MLKKKSIILATHNQNKIKEFDHLCESFITFQAYHGRLPKETGYTFQENALIKARFVWKEANLSVLADDSGLCIPALNDFPGIHSARFWKLCKCDLAYVIQELKKYGAQSGMLAEFVCVLAFIDQGIEYIFKGTISGNLKLVMEKYVGFGYDSIFVPKGFTSTFSHMPLIQKNIISHRAVAIKNLRAMLCQKACAI